MGISITWVIDFSITMVIIQPIAQPTHTTQP